MGSRKIRIELTLEELHQTIAESIAVAIAGQGATLARMAPIGEAGTLGAGILRPRSLTSEELERSLNEIGRHAAGSLLAFSVTERNH